MKHEEFAERAGRRLERMADRLESEANGPGIDGETPNTITVRVKELKVAAHLVRDEAVAARNESPEEMVAENLSLEAQG